MLSDPFAFTRADLLALIEASTAVGYRVWSPWSLHLTQVGVADAAALLADAGIRTPVVEALSQWSGGPGRAQQRELDMTLDVADTIGADTIGVCVLEPEADLAAAAEGLAASSEVAATRGKRLSLEFLPWSAVPDLRTAWGLITASGAANAGLLLDTWHWTRMPGGPDDTLLRSIPGERIHYIQLCDAATPTGLEPMAECMSARLPTGDGVVDFDAFWDAVVATGAEPIVMTEVFNTALADRGVDAHARATWDGLGRILDPS
jgi:sugar phosphate isomerase/epimerase